MDRYNSPRGDRRRFEEEQRQRRRGREHEDESGTHGWRDWVSDEPYERGFRYDYERGIVDTPTWRDLREDKGMRYGDRYFPGPYTGLGPRGYRRSDQDIFNDICSRLTDHGDIDAREIEVEVDDGQVMLTGTIDSRHTKFMVEDTVDSVPGVREIQNRLSVRRPAPGEDNLRKWSGRRRRTPDTWRQQRRSLEGSQFGERYGEDYGYGREGEYIEPESSRYRGTEFVDRYDEPEYTELDRYAPYSGIGPRGYNRSDDRICEEVCERLTHHGALDASDIQVDVQDGEVIMRGTVGDRRSKRLAEDLAESIIGVNDVRNELRLGQTRSTGRERRDWPRQVNRGQSVVETEGKTIGETGEVRDRGASRAKFIVGSDGDVIGTLIEMRDNDMVVKRTNFPDISIPRDMIQSISGDRIVLKISHGELHQLAKNQDTWKRE